MQGAHHVAQRFSTMTSPPATAASVVSAPAASRMARVGRIGGASSTASWRISPVANRARPVLGSGFVEAAKNT
jgi:hypothetical protein